MVHQPGVRQVFRTNGHPYLFKNEVHHTTSTLKISQSVGDLRERNSWHILLVPGRFLENMGTNILVKKGYHTPPGS